jgi:hypothetical protein
MTKGSCSGRTTWRWRISTTAGTSGSRGEEAGAADAGDGGEVLVVQGAGGGEHEPHGGLVVVHGHRVAVLAGLDGDADVAEVAEVAEQGAVEDLLEAEHDGDAEGEGDLAVAQDVGHAHERGGGARGAVEVEEDDRGGAALEQGGEEGEQL